MAKYDSVSNFLNKEVQNELNDVANPSKALNTLTAKKGAKNSEVRVKIQDLNTEKTQLQGVVNQLADKVKELEKVCENGACFAAGTKLLAKGIWVIGSRQIERITPDDWVASLDENRFSAFCTQDDSTMKFYSFLGCSHMKTLV